MRGFYKVLLVVLLAPLSLAARAEIPPLPTTPAASLPGQGAATGFLHPMQLQTNEITVLLEHLESQNIYLKHLENVRSAVERELSIVRLMSECNRLGSACTGSGITRKEIFAQPGGEEAVFPLSPSPLPEVELPRVVAVYQGTASLLYRQRYVEARPGETLGPFTVLSVGVDGVKINGPQGQILLSPRWGTLEAAPGFSASVHHGPAGANRHAR